MPPIPPRLQMSERHAAAARRRRRRGQIRLAGLIVVIVVVVVVVVVATGSGSSNGAHAANASSPRHGRSRASARTGTHSTPTNPLTTTRISRYIAGRQGQIGAAVLDLASGREWTLRPGARDQTASIVKNDILQTVLYQAQERHTPIADVETDTAEDMIEASDNDDASDLYDQIGDAAGLNAYNAKAGLTRTSGGAGGFWGETLTTAPDQIKLLRQLAVPSGSLLSAASRAYQLGLMEDIDPGENWGATGGVPTSGVTVALKNGWVPLTSDTDWEVNTIGWVKGDGHDYLIALLSAHDPSENYGIDTLDQLSEDIYDTLGPAPKPWTKTIRVVPTG